ncbi:MAG: hypothetical protein WDM81_17605 [Rhizomicrobium sp.]
MKKKPTVAIVGATGAVGAEFVGCLQARNFPVGTLKALASTRSAGRTLDFRGETIVVEELTEKSFDGVDIALFSAGGGISRKFAPVAVKAGAVVGRQFLGLPHGSRRAAGDPGDQRPPHQGP